MLPVDNMTSPTLEFNYDISCPFAYIASTRVRALAERTNAKLIYRPVLLGAIYRATAAPQGAGGSASDVFNPTKKAVTGMSMQRTLKRYKIKYNPPPQHPRKTVNALRLLYCVEDDRERRVLSDALFKAYWVEGRDVSDSDVILQIVKESGIKSAATLSTASFNDANARKQLEIATAEAIERGAFGVPGFWIPGAQWTDFSGGPQTGRFFWGQDRMHFVEATLLSLQQNNEWNRVSSLRSLMPRSIPSNKVHGKVKLEFWYDFSSPWAFLGYTQLERLKRTFGHALEVEMKPFLLGILFREIGAPNLPMAAVSPAKALWSRQDHADWSKYWNAVNAQDGEKDKSIDFHWADIFPIRTPTVLRVAIVEPRTVPLLYSACWEHNANVSEESVLAEVLDKGGYNGADLIAKSNTPAIKTKLRELTAEAKDKGICGVPTYRVLRDDGGGEWKLAGGLVWGQDEIGVVEDLIAGWEPERSNELAEPRKVDYGGGNVGAKL
ncbi:thioredoxin-like protein [Cucurbitaria berberidis CBS 394.84]|uniref:Thioredoxin-like protein n=1 Tax=Cucurbitaria berberidis CBS 394.84 TaxID=1168544 RepID=A0A9P4G777_9PLEO|nr:thioredoxin-like protein [Cucurbitaria berberidis CBS 394.84]KAF1840316.1 thioredoxin-like protein [Cucurbitaria berberidis CBS 394.84]